MNGMLLTGERLEESRHMAVTNALFLADAAAAEMPSDVIAEIRAAVEAYVFPDGGWMVLVAGKPASSGLSPWMLNGGRFLSSVTFVTATRDDSKGEVTIEELWKNDHALYVDVKMHGRVMPTVRYQLSSVTFHQTRQQEVVRTEQEGRFYAGL